MLRTSQGMLDSSSCLVEPLSADTDRIVHRDRDVVERQWKLLAVPTWPRDEPRGGDRERHDRHAALRCDVQDPFLERSRRTMRAIGRNRRRAPVLNEMCQLARGA